MPAYQEYPALIVAKRWIESGRYKKVIVAGGDILSHFVPADFYLSESISTERCCLMMPGDKLIIKERLVGVILLS